MKTRIILGILVMFGPCLFAQFRIDVTPDRVDVKGDTASIVLEKDINFVFATAALPSLTMTIEVMSKANTVAKWVATATNGSWDVKNVSNQDGGRLTAPVVGGPGIFILNLHKEKDPTLVHVSFTDANGVALKLSKNGVAVNRTMLSLPVAQPGTTPTDVISQKGSVIQGDCRIKDDAAYYFIPAFYKRGFEPGACVDCLNDYSVVYDIASSAICYFKREECDCSKQPNPSKPNNANVGCSCKEGGRQYCYVAKERIRPKVGSNVSFHLLGYYPSYDSVSSTFAFESKNLELRDQFQRAITPAPQQADSAKETKPKVANAADRPGLSEVNTFFNKMKSEFVEYFSYLLSSAPNKQLVQSDIEYINRQLNSYCLTVVEFSPRGLTVAAQSYINTYVIGGKEEQKQKDEILAVVRQAALYYGFILNYHAINIPVVQMKNEDQFQWTVNFYKKKTVVDTRLYTMMISGGWKIDFSSGFVFNNLNDNEYAIQYDIADITPDDGNDNPVEAAKIIKQDKGDYKVDIGLMAHIYPRTGRRANAGLNTGVVLRNGTTVKYLLGGSIMLGYEQRFVLSFGAVAGSVKKLDQTYEKAMDKYVAKSTLTTISSSVPTVDFWDWGGFVAISYNLGGVSLFSKVK